MTLTDRPLARFLHERSLSGRADFHLHSNYSDGLQSPTDLMAEAVEKQLTALALTDHDTMEGIPEARRALGQKALLVSGVELSARFDQDEIHILAYFEEDEPAGMMAFLDQQIRERKERNSAMIRKLRDLDFDIREEDLARYGNDRTLPGRVHMALWLVEFGGLASIGEAFSSYLKVGAPAFVYRKRHLAAEVASLIREAGGVAVVAHPQQYGWCDLTAPDSAALFRDRLTRLKEAGITGVECFHGQASEEESLFMQEAALDLGLICTAGSDSHGRRETHSPMFDGRSF